MKYVRDMMNHDTQVWTKIGEKGGLKGAQGLFAQVGGGEIDMWEQGLRGWKTCALVQGKWSCWLVICVWINTNCGERTD